MIGECVIHSRGSAHIKLSNSRDHCEESCSVEFAVGDGPPMTTLISCSLVPSSPLCEKSVSQRNGPEGRAPSTDVVTPSNVMLYRLELSSRRAEMIMAVPTCIERSVHLMHKMAFPIQDGYLNKQNLTVELEGGSVSFSLRPPEMVRAVVWERIKTASLSADELTVIIDFARNGSTCTIRIGDRRIIIVHSGVCIRLDKLDGQEDSQDGCCRKSGAEHVGAMSV